MNELQLYELIRLIFAQSEHIKGRFHVLEGYGNDLNADELNEVVSKIAITQTKTKYPLVAMMPPVEFPGDEQNRFRIEMYFLVQQYQNGKGGFKTPNSVNTSSHPIVYDWQDMRAICENFLEVFSLYLTETYSERTIMLGKNSAVIRRYSNQNNDRLAGISLSIDIYLQKDPCVEIEGFNIENVLAINIPENPHPLHKL